jgi:hypothetical protein
MNEICPICNTVIKSSDEICTLQEKGASGVNKCSKERRSDVLVCEGATLHVNCRKRFTNKKDIKRFVKHVLFF